MMVKFPNHGQVLSVNNEIMSLGEWRDGQTQNKA